MNMALEYPFTAAKVRDLKIGQFVKLSGRVFTGRDRLHKYLCEGGGSPVELKDGALYHCGPVAMRKEGVWVIRAAGPTTSMRQEPYMASLIEQHHLRVIIGKGGMGEKTRKACARYGCVYLQAVGGAASVLANSITEVTGVDFVREFGIADALWNLVVKDFEAVVAIDTHGRSLHKRVKLSSKRALREITG
jgi:tartrate/fumarate subfamily iron-sulfur-dependent hydro-lyase beta chain